MTFNFIVVESKSSAWFNEVLTTYHKKISPFISFNICKIKSSKLSREDKEVKVLTESKKIEKIISASDHVILFDESGKEFFSAEALALELKQTLENGKTKIIYIIGGAFGVSDKLKSRANVKIKLSNFVMNHQVAATVALESLYRSFTIIKGLPYHNK